MLHLLIQDYKNLRVYLFYIRHIHTRGTLLATAHVFWAMKQHQMELILRVHSYLSVLSLLGLMLKESKPKGI